MGSRVCVAMSHETSIDGQDSVRAVPPHAHHGMIGHLLNGGARFVAGGNKGVSQNLEGDEVSRFLDILDASFYFNIFAISPPIFNFDDVAVGIDLTLCSRRLRWWYPVVPKWQGR
jgi:hypothetical protein